MNDRSVNDRSALPPIAAHFIVQPDRPLAEAAGGGRPAFAVTDRRDPKRPLMAVQLSDGIPCRAHAIAILSTPMDEGAIAGVLGPLAIGAAAGPDRPGLFVVCPAPPGLALWGADRAGREPWSDAALLSCVLAPAVEALSQLHARHVTHRAIRPDNLFQSAPGQPVTLGCAWAAPPAFHQPALVEPPYAAMCLPAGRGEGTPADDIYALGATLLLLALDGAQPPVQSDVAVIRRKLEMGSFEAIARDSRVSPIIADLTRAMLAEDPEHRPTLAMLRDPALLRGRRVAVRASHRAQRPLDIGGVPVWDVRSLAFAMAREPARCTPMLRSGEIDTWLRRAVGDSSVSARLDGLARPAPADDARTPRTAAAALAKPSEDPADFLRATRVVAQLDPLAPLCFGGVAIWPDGIGPALAVADADEASAPIRATLQTLVLTEAIGIWSTTRGPADQAKLQMQARQYATLLHKRGWAGGMPRLRYALNPLLPCRSRMLNGLVVFRPGDLLPALDRVAASNERGGSPIDQEIAAFLAATQTRLAEGPAIAFGNPTDPAQTILLQLRLLAALQANDNTDGVPALAAWMAEAAVPALARWHNLPERERRQTALLAKARTGRLIDLLDILDDRDALEVDRKGALAAADHVARLDQQIQATSDGGPHLTNGARRMAEQAVGAIGATALAASVIASLLV